MAEDEVIKYKPEGSIEDFFSFGSYGLTPTKAKKLEDELETKPDDLAMHLQLLKHYYHKRMSGPQRQQAKVPFLRHLVWFIDNQPRHIILQHPFGHPNDETLSVGFSHWLKQVRQNPKDVAILAHAAKFCYIHRPLDAIKFLKSVAQLDGNNDKFPYELARVCMGMAYVGPKLERQNFALQALKNMKVATERYTKYKIDFSPLDYHFEYDLEELAELAIHFKLFEEAKELATILLNRDAIEESRGYSTYRTEKGKASRVLMSICKAHSILGRIAIAEKNVALAKEQLEQLRTIASFDIFDLKLPAALLKKREREIVLKYIKHVRNLNRGDQKLSLWIEEIEQGRTPRMS